MNAGEAFFDSNVVVYLLSADTAKAERAEDVIAQGGRVSVQVLNEVASVARRKLGLGWPEVSDITAQLRAVCSVEPLTVETHERGLQLAQRFRLSVYDGMIMASALLAGCTTLFSEDLQHGLRIDNRLTVRNPFSMK